MVCASEICSGTFVNSRLTRLVHATCTGFIIVRGLIHGELLDRVCGAKCKSDLPGTEYETLAFNAWEQDPVWLEVAQASNIAQVRCHALQKTNTRELDAGELGHRR